MVSIIYGRKVILLILLNGSIGERERAPLWDRSKSSDISGILYNKKQLK